jgi:hypothetical protein
MCAVKEEQGYELAKILLENGADFTIENDQGWVFQYLISYTFEET